MGLTSRSWASLRLFLPARERTTSRTSFCFDTALLRCKWGGQLQRTTDAQSQQLAPCEKQASLKYQVTHGSEELAQDLGQDNESFIRRRRQALLRLSVGCLQHNALEGKDQTADFAPIDVEEAELRLESCLELPKISGICVIKCVILRLAFTVLALF